MGTRPAEHLETELKFEVGLDFVLPDLSGLAYGVGGSMSRVADSVFLLAPTNVELSEEEKERLEARGLYRR